MKKRLKTLQKTDLIKFYFLSIVLCLSLLPVSSVSRNNEDILMVIHDREISRNEFLHLWKKNNLYTKPESIDDYLELFVNFHLKVAHAREEGIHQQASFMEELAGYRKRLAQPWMGEPDMEEYLVKEAYGRLLYDINASHILVRLAPGYSPDDTLKAWEKAMQIRERIIEGETFEEVARATSDDPSAKVNSGNLGYFTALHMVYPFENAVYEAEPGELSIPVRTRFGYHIIRVNDRRKSRGELKTAHIMIGFNKYQEQEAGEKVLQVYRDLLAGNSFEELAKEYSTDNNTAALGGVLPWFGSGRIVPEFEKAAFELGKPGEISEPVRTAYGWHIIKLIDRREIPPFDEIKNELSDRIRNSGDERSQLIRAALVDRLKNEWNFTEYSGALELFYRIIDESIFTGRWTIPGNLPLNQVLFSVTGQNVRQRDFARFISENAPRRNPWPVDEYIYSLYNEFVDHWLIEHENRNLENKYPEFRYLMKEYEDGMLLFEITDREVWSKATSDIEGLEEFYSDNRNNYMWGTRISASIFTTENHRAAQRGARRAQRSTRSDRRNDDWIIDPLNRRNEEPVIRVERAVFSGGDNEITDSIEWEEGASEIIYDGKQYQFVLIHKILDPEPMTLDESRGKVISDYQDHLEKRWVGELRNRYNVIINKYVLSDIR